MCAADPPAAPADLVRLRRKGRIAPGCDANFVLWDPDQEWTVVGAELAHRHALTPYEGMRLPGRVRATYLRGRPIFEDGVFAASPTGQLLDRENA